MNASYFYSRPCGRGDTIWSANRSWPQRFLLTPLREGRRRPPVDRCACLLISTHAPAGGATRAGGMWRKRHGTFLLTPLREGRPLQSSTSPQTERFLLTPLREGRPVCAGNIFEWRLAFLLTPLREGRRKDDEADLPAHNISTHAPAGGATFSFRVWPVFQHHISTHAPAGGATAIFHKSVMRFCGKLPKDDTVLCLASFGFPRRDPKAVYLA